MVIPLLQFFLCALTIVSVLLMITSTNPINMVLFLIFVFINISLLLILFGIPYLGLLLLIVYVGAVAVLFLFVVMMLNLKKLEKDNTNYFVLGSLIILILILELSFLFIDYSFPSYINVFLYWKDWFFSLSGMANQSSTEFKLIALLIFNKYSIFLFCSGLALFVALIGAIYLTNDLYGFRSLQQSVYIQLKQSNKLFLKF